MTLGYLMDLMNRDYDSNDPKFLKEVQLSIYRNSKEKDRGKIVDSILKENMVLNPQTIGLDKNDSCLNGMEEGLKAIDKMYDQSVETQEVTQSRTR